MMVSRDPIEVPIIISGAVALVAFDVYFTDFYYVILYIKLMVSLYDHKISS